MKAGGEAKSHGHRAAALAKWAKVLPSMFPPGTGEGENVGVFAGARGNLGVTAPASIRLRPTMRLATARLAALAAANDTAGFTKQLEEVNQACGACHARYKAGDQGPPKK